MAVSDSPFVGLGTLKLRRGMRAALRECTRSTKPHGSDDEGDKQHFQTVRNIHSLTSSFDFRRATLETEGEPQAIHEPDWKSRLWFHVPKVRRAVPGIRRATEAFRIE